MSQHDTNIESLFRSAFNNHKVQPSSRLLARLKLKLWWNEFLQFNLGRFNLYYALVALGGLSYLGVNIIANTDTPLNTDGITEVNHTTNSVKKTEEIPAMLKEEPALKQPEAEPARTAPLTMSSMPAASFVPSVMEGCAPLRIEFKNKSKKVKSYHWDFGDGTTSDRANPVHVYQQGGRYTAILTIHTKDNQKSVNAQDIFVLEAPDARLDIDIQQSDIEDKAVAFKNQSVNAYNYTWHFGDSKSSNETNPVHTYNNYGVYQVKLIATNENGCSDTAMLANKFIDKAYNIGFPFSFMPDINGASNQGYYDKASIPESIFYPDYTGINDYYLVIKAPNGMQVFETSNIKQGWNGFMRGRMAPGGIYQWMAKGSYENGKTFELKGNVKVKMPSNMYNSY